METLKEKTAKGMFWGGMNNGVQQAIGLAFGIILGRLLSPEDYGMMAMISVFSLIATTLQNSGFTTALANLKAPTHDDYNAVFWFNVIVGAAMYAVLFFCAPLIADYYHTERLTPLCRYAFLSIVIASLGTAQSAFLFRNLMAKQQAKAGMAAVACSSVVGAAMAFGGMAYWSLATQGLVFVGVSTAMQWHYSPWRPSLRVDFGPAKRMFRFSVKVLATSIAVHINSNVLNILLGRYFSPHAAGSYNQAYQWSSKCFYLVQGMVQQVAQPVLAGLNDQKGRQLAVLRKMARFTAFISFPLLFGLALVAEEFIVTAITAKWLVSAGLLQILAVGGAVMPLHTLLSNTLLSKGRSDLYLWCTVGLGVAEIATMVCIWPLGIRTMVVAYAAINVAWVFVWLFFVRRLTGYGLLMFLRDTLPFAAIAALVMCAVRFATAWVDSLAALLAVRVVLAAALYYAAMKIGQVRIMKECEQYIKARAAGKKR